MKSKNLFENLHKEFKKQKQKKYYFKMFTVIILVQLKNKLYSR